MHYLAITIYVPWVCVCTTWLCLDKWLRRWRRYSRGDGASFPRKCKKQIWREKKKIVEISSQTNNSVLTCSADRSVVTPILFRCKMKIIIFFFFFFPAVAAAAVSSLSGKHGIDPTEQSSACVYTVQFRLISQAGNSPAGSYLVISPRHHEKWTTENKNCSPQERQFHIYRPSEGLTQNK